MDCRVGLKVLLAMTLTTTGQRDELRSHHALVENLESHDRANGAVATAGVLTAAAHTEKTTRIGEELPRAVASGLRRRPNALLSTGDIS